VKTITLREYETSPIPYRVTKQELDDLISLSPWVTLTPTGQPDEYSIRARGGVVGSIVTPHVRVLLSPKASVSVENLFFLLDFAPDLIRWAKETVPFLADMDLFRIIAWMLDREIRKQLARGLVRGYVDRSDSLPTVRGRINMTAQLSRHQSMMLPLECAYQEFTDDVEINRLIKGACRAVQRSALADAQLAGRFRELISRFSDVTDVEYQHLPATLTFNRLNEHWHPATVLARLVLGRHSLRDHEGSVIGSAFLVDMNKVFEKFVESVVREEVQKAGWYLDRQADRDLTDSIAMKPDLVLQRGNRDYAVGDAKYKALEIDEWPHPDLYQLLAYCVGLGLPRGVLVYASEAQSRVEHVRTAAIDLEVIGIDLSAPYQEVLAAAQNAARRLIGHAEQASRSERRALLPRAV
jgi:5-methylcytosine-specific restriction enzyme subunit McrC